MRFEEFLSQHVETRTYPKDDVIVRQGQQAEEVYVVKTGKVSVFRSHQGGESVLAELGEGEIFGEMAVLRFDEHTLSVRAVTETELYVVTPDILHQELQQAHPLIRKIIETLLDRMKEVNEILIDLDQAGA